MNSKMNSKMKMKISLILAGILAVGVFLAVYYGQPKGHTTNTILTPEQVAQMPGDPLQNLAIKESQWLVTIDGVKAEIDKDYQSWQQGKMTKEDFVEKMQQKMGTVNGVYSAYDLHMEANPLPESEKNQPVYADGIIYGNKLRQEVNDFIFITNKGILDMQTKKFKQLTAEQIKAVYQNKMGQNYADYHAKLVKALDQFKNTK